MSRQILKGALVFSLLLLSIIAVGLVIYPKYPVQLDNAANLFLTQIKDRTETVSPVFASLSELIPQSSSTGSMMKSTATTTISSTTTEIESTTSTTNLQDAIVNIYCEQKAEGYKRIMSGTGFLVSATGAILTNAHVAQFLLLKDAPQMGETECQASTNLVESQKFDVELLYISPTWLLKHADMLASETLRGTGENDFALLYISSTKDGTALPQIFTHIPPATNPLSKDRIDDTIILVGYPKSDDVDLRGSRTTATTTITDIFTFGDGQADIFSLSPSSLGYQGASGGPVIDHLGRAIGVIATKDDGTMILNAITTAHIDRSIRTETGFDLITILQGDLMEKSKLFNEHITPILQQILTKNLE